MSLPEVKETAPNLNGDLKGTTSAEVRVVYTFGAVSMVPDTKGASGFAIWVGVSGLFRWNSVKFVVPGQEFEMVRLVRTSSVHKDDVDRFFILADIQGLTHGRRDPVFRQVRCYLDEAYVSRMRVCAGEESLEGLG